MPLNPNSQDPTMATMSNTADAIIANIAAAEFTTRKTGDLVSNSVLKTTLDAIFEGAVFEPCRDGAGQLHVIRKLLYASRLLAVSCFANKAVEVFDNLPKSRLEEP
jgi:hypothetical protein